jgi:hypothetical protein
MQTNNYLGRVGLARILEVSENATRDIEARGEISPVAFVDGRPLFSAEQARELKATRNTKRLSRLNAA